MANRGDDDFLQDVIDDDPEAEAFIQAQGGLVERTKEETLDEDLRVYRTAWIDLQHDRHSGDMGGSCGIYYRAISRYAADHFVAPDDFETLCTLIRAQDMEYLAWLAEKRAADEDKRKAEKDSGASS